MKSKFLRGALAVAMTTALTPVGALTAFAAEYDAQAASDPVPAVVAGAAIDNANAAANTAKKPAYSMATSGMTVTQTWGTTAVGDAVAQYNVTVGSGWTVPWNANITPTPTWQLNLGIQLPNEGTWSAANVDNATPNWTIAGTTVASTAAAVVADNASNAYVTGAAKSSTAVLSIGIDPTLFSAGNSATMDVAVTNGSAATPVAKISITAESSLKFDIQNTVGSQIAQTSGQQNANGDYYAIGQPASVYGTKSLAGKATATYADGLLSAQAALGDGTDGGTKVLNDSAVSTQGLPAKATAGVLTVEYYNAPGQPANLNQINTGATGIALSSANLPTVLDLNGGTIANSVASAAAINVTPTKTVTVQNGTITNGNADYIDAAKASPTNKAALIVSTGTGTTNLDATVTTFVNVAADQKVIYNGKTYAPEAATNYVQMNGVLVPIITAAPVTVATNAESNSRGTSDVATGNPYQATAVLVAENVTESTTTLPAAANKADFVKSYVTNPNLTTDIQNAYQAAIDQIKAPGGYSQVGKTAINNVVVSTYFAVNFEADCSYADDDAAYYTLNITPMYSVYAANAASLASLNAVTKTGEVIDPATGKAVPGNPDSKTEISAVLLESGELTGVTGPTTVVAGVSKVFVDALTATSDENGIFVTHTLDGALESCAVSAFAPAAGTTIAKATFAVTQGFSPFTFSKTDPVAELPSITVGTAPNTVTTYYNTLQDAVNAVANNGTIVLQADNDETVTVPGAKKFTIDVHTNSKTYNGKVLNSNGAEVVPVKAANGDLTYTVTGDEVAVDKTTAVWGQAWWNTMTNLVDKSGFTAGACKNIVVATSDNWQDALSASGFAGLLNAPIVLTPKSELNADASALIKKYAAADATVYVIGGPIAVDEAVVDAIKALGVTAERVYGQTATDTAEELFTTGEDLGTWANGAILVTSTDYKDALCAAPYAYKTQTPVLLTMTGSNEVDDATAAVFEGVTNKIAVGGRFVISDDVVSTLGLNRIWGEICYETSNAFAAYCLTQGMQANNSSVATANGFTDALAAAPFAANNNAPMLLADAGYVQVVDGFITTNAASIDNVNIVSGPLVLANSVVAAINAALA